MTHHHYIITQALHISQPRLDSLMNGELTLLYRPFGSYTSVHWLASGIQGYPDKGAKRHSIPFTKSEDSCWELFTVNLANWRYAPRVSQITDIINEVIIYSVHRTFLSI